MALVIRILSHLPLWILYGLADFLFFLLCYVVRYRRKVVLENLRNSFPEKTEKELSEIARGFYRNLADIGVEILRIPSIRKEELQKRVKFTNLDLYLNTMKNGESVIVLTGHQCNWEWLLLAASTTHSFPIDAVYKPLHSQSMDKLFIEMRSRFGAIPLAMKDVYRSVIKHKNEVRCMAMVADQTPPGGEIQLFLPFLNQHTAFFVGADKIARNTGFPVLTVFMRRIKRGYYEVEFKAMKRAPYEKEFELIELYAKALEKDIAAHPSDWLWSHKRWKHKDFKKNLSQDLKS